MILSPHPVQAVKDIDTLLEVREAALEDPLAFVSKLQSGQNLGLPVRQKLPDMPNINWDKYNLGSVHLNKPETRNSKTTNGKAKETHSFFTSYVVYFDQRSGAAHTRKLVKILFWPFSTFFVYFKHFSVIFCLKSRQKV